MIFVQLLRRNIGKNSNVKLSVSAIYNLRYLFEKLFKKKYDVIICMKKLFDANKTPNFKILPYVFSFQ